MSLTSPAIGPATAIRSGSKPMRRRRELHPRSSGCLRPVRGWLARPTPMSWPTASTARTSHYGTPINPKAPGRIPGGSSSGSAAAVSGGLVDFALGTDCGGSVRLPASYCGIYGIRTTHGLIPADGIVDLAASFDTVGWFARDPQTMRRVGDVLLPVSDFKPKRLLIAQDAFAFAGSEVTDALAAPVSRLKAAFTDHREVSVYTGDPAAWPRNIPHPAGQRNPQAARRVDRRSRSEFRSRHYRALPLDRAPSIAAEVERMRPLREEVARHMDALLGDDALLCLPTAPGHCAEACDAGRRARSVSCAGVCVAVCCRAGALAANLAAARHDGGLSPRTLAHRAARR